MNQTVKELQDIYNCIGTFKAPDDDSCCSEELLQEDIKEKFILSDEGCFQFITAHKGNGKTFFLHKLAQSLEKEKIFTVYCSLEGIIDLNDFHYTDLMLALLDSLAKKLEKTEIYLNYSGLGSINLRDLKDFIPISPLEFELKFAKILEYIYFSNFIKQKARDILDKQAVTMSTALLNIINQAKEELKKSEYKDIVFIIDGLDKVITFNYKDENPLDTLLFKYDRLFKFLNTKIIMTLPVSYILPPKTALINSIWGSSVNYLPLLKGCSKDLDNDNKGIPTIKSVLESQLSDITNDLNTIITKDALIKAIKLSSGNIKQMFRLIQLALHNTDSLPIYLNRITSAKNHLEQGLIKLLPLKSLNLSSDSEYLLNNLSYNELSYLLENNIFFYHADDRPKFLLNELLIDLLND